MKKSIFLIVLFVFFTQFVKAADDIYPHKWKVVNTGLYFNTVKFCNNFKNVLCASDSTILVLNAENGDTVIFNKYPFKITSIDYSDELNKIAVGGNFSIIAIINFETLQIEQNINIKQFTIDLSFLGDKLYAAHPLDQDSNGISIINMKNFSFEKIKSKYGLRQIELSKRDGIFYTLHYYTTVSGNSIKAYTTLNQFDPVTKAFTKEPYISQHEGSFFSLKISPKNNYLGFKEEGVGPIIIYNIQNKNQTKEVKEINFRCYAYGFSYNEKNILYDYSVVSVNPRAYFYSIEANQVQNQMVLSTRGAVDINDKNEFLTFGDRVIALRPEDFLSSIGESIKKSLIEIHNNFVIMNFYVSRNSNHQITISDLSGREVKKYNLSPDNSTPLDLNLLPRGVYLISLSSNNNMLQTIKFIKE